MVRVLELARLNRPVYTHAQHGALRAGRTRTIARLEALDLICDGGLTDRGRLICQSLMERVRIRAHADCKAIAARRRAVSVTADDAGLLDRVLTVVPAANQPTLFRNQPCPDCPWRIDAVLKFSPEAFRHSARTAIDCAVEVFACHSSNPAAPALCAGFLLNGSDHNLSARLLRIQGKIPREPGDKLNDAGVPLHATYRAMAIANGVDPDDPALKDCRD